MTDVSCGPPMDSRDGKIVTFYSFKGGTGRTMALANVAWILAANGHRVLVADWDLEAPGLHRFFHPFMDADLKNAPGIIDLIRTYEWAVARNGPALGNDQDSSRRTPVMQESLQAIIRDRVQVQQYAFSLEWTFPHNGSIDFLSPGRQNSDYAPTLGALDWENFYNRLSGAQFFDALRADMKRRYDYILIDSRTGLSDVGDICTVHLPDVLVDCFTLSIQGIEGAAQVAKAVQDNYAAVRGIRILPVPMRVDLAEKERVDAGHAVAGRRFAGLPVAMSETERKNYWAAVEVPYQAFYAYEETLAVFGDVPGSPASLLSSYERLTAHITDGAVTALPPMDEPLRLRTKRLFTRRPPSETDEIALYCDSDDQVWAEWIIDVLGRAGFAVRSRQVDEFEKGESLRRLTVLSSAHPAGSDSLSPALPDSIAVYVADIRPIPAFSASSSAFLAGLSEQEATKRLLHLLGAEYEISSGAPRTLGIRYPGTEPKVLNAPARNVRFTGREGDLAQLRDKLRAGGTTVLLPVTLQGLGGVGKTQVAIEYVRRFKTNYDLVWWLNCGQPQFIDSQLGDLGMHMQEVFGVGAPAGATVAEIAKEVLRVLSRPEPVQRWLVVFDNADDIEMIERFLPEGNGHVLITSRNRAWTDRARALQVDVFTRAESIMYLRRRVAQIAEAEANRVADVLGDLPLAVATAEAWLVDTGISVADYLHQLELRGPRTLSISQLVDYPESVTRAWDLSLSRLRDRSVAAARLFELCSVMAPDIGLDLLYSPAMAAVLAPLDPALSEPMVIGRVVQEINRLALAKLDPNARELQIHSLVQAVVQDRMSDEQLAAARSDVHRVLAAARPRREVDDPDTWSRYRMLWPHIIPSRAMASSEESVRQLLIDRVRYLGQRGDLEGGWEVGTSTESAWEQMLAAEPEGAMTNPLRRQLLHLRFNLANILRDQAQFDESRQLDDAVLAEQRALLGDDHPHTLMTAGGLAADLRALGRYSEALVMDKEIHPSWTELYGEDHVRTLAAANNLAVSYRLTGDFASSLRLDEDTFERRRVTAGPQHPQTLLSAANIGRDLLEAGRYADAVSRVSAVQESYSEVLGSDAPATLNAQVLLGVALRSAGYAEKAEPHFRSAWEGLVRRLGSNSTDALACRLSRSANLLALDRFEEAQVEIRAVLAVYEQRLGQTHPHTLVCRVNLASALRLQREHGPALHMARPVVEELKKQLGAEHPYTLAVMMVLGTLYADDGDLSSARRLEEHATERLTQVLGPRHPDTLRCRANLLLTQEAQGLMTAGAQRHNVIDQLAGQLGPAHPSISTLREGRRLLRALDPQPF